MHEVRVETNTALLRLVFHDLAVSEVADQRIATFPNCFPR